MIFAMFLTLRRRYRKHEVNVVYTLFWLGLRYRNLIDWCSLPSLSLSLSPSLSVSLSVSLLSLLHIQFPSPSLSQLHGL
jgi:hypothetical protein